MWLRRITKTVLVLVMIIVLGAVGLVVFVDPNHYKPMIVDAVQKNTDRTLTIDGNMSWRFWPGVGIEIDNVTLSNAPGFGDTPFVKMGSASVYVRILPLLTKKIYIDTLEIKDADIYLARRRDGKTNWEDLSAPKDSAEMVKVSTTPPAETTSSPVDLKIAKLDIINSHLTWDDQMLGQTRTLSNFSFSGGLGAGGMAPFETQGVAELKPENIQYTFDANGKYVFDMKKQSFQGKDWQVTTQVSGVKNIPQAEKITLTFDSVLFDMTKGNFSADKFVLQAMGGEVDFSGQGENIFKSPSINGSLSARNIDVKAIAMLLNQPIETTDPNVLRKVNIEAKALGSDNRFTFDPVRIEIDETKLNGQVAVNNWENKEIAFSLTGNQINLDRYMAPKKSGTGAAASGSSAGKKSGDMISSDMDSTLRALKLSGHLAMGSITVQKMALSNLSMDVASANGVLKIAPFQANLYGGALVANATLNVQGAQPQWAIDTKLENINLSPMLKQMAEKEVITGRLTLNSQLKMVGRNSQAMTQSLNGAANFNIANGVLQGVDLGYWLAMGEALIQRKPESVTAKNTGQTSFLAAFGNFLINNGVANNQQLVMYSDSVYMQGSGQFNLVRETIDYAVQVSKAHRTADGKYTASDKGIPLRITGTFSNPSVGIDTKNLPTTLIKGLVGGAVAKKLLGGESSSSDNNSTSNNSSSSPTTQETPEQKARDQLKNLIRGF